MLTADCASKRTNTGCWYQNLHRKGALYFHAYNDDDNNQNFCYLTTNVEANIEFLHSLLVWYLKVIVYIQIFDLKEVKRLKQVCILPGSN